MFANWFLLRENELEMLNKVYFSCEELDHLVKVVCTCEHIQNLICSSLYDMNNKYKYKVCQEEQPK
jgi:hypothetical protein